jgi:hypothetical protein
VLLWHVTIGTNVAQRVSILRNITLLALLSLVIYTRPCLVSYHILLLVLSLSVLQG